MADVNADWVEELRRRVTPDNLDMIAEQLDVLQGVILAALVDGDGGQTRMNLEDRVRRLWMGDLDQQIFEES